MSARDSERYSPWCLEGEFSELPLLDVLGSPKITHLGDVPGSRCLLAWWLARPLREERVNLMALEDDVRQASEQFYAALNSTLDGDSSPMEQIWSHGSDVSAMHPFGGRILGWDEVRASWEQAAQAFSGGQVALDEMVVVPITEDAAYTLGTEHGQGRLGDETVGIEWCVTNAYRREADGWKIVHHHTDFSTEVAQALGM